MSSRESTAHFDDPSARMRNSVAVFDDSKDLSRRYSEGHPSFPSRGSGAFFERSGFQVATWAHNHSDILFKLARSLAKLTPLEPLRSGPEGFDTVQERIRAVAREEFADLFS